MTKKPEDHENHRRQRPQKSTTEVVKRIHGLMAEMMQAREARMRYLAESFGLDDGYNKKVLDRLLDASEDTGDAAPFKLATDIGWLFRGFLLAQGQARNKKTWLHATKVLKKAHKEWDYFDQRDYTTFQSLFAVPDEVHAEITEIVDGLSQFSESRELFKPYRYQRIVAAIVAACI